MADDDRLSLPTHATVDPPAPQPLKFPVRIGEKRLICPMDEGGHIILSLEEVSVSFSLVDILTASGITPAEAQKALTKYKKEYREKGGEQDEHQREVQGAEGDTAEPDHG